MESDRQIKVGESIGPDFFKRCVDEVAAELIGCFLFVDEDSDCRGGRIIDAEAYCQNDPAAHCHKNKDKRFKDEVCLFKNGSRRESVPKRMHDSMYKSGGHVYVYPNSKHCYLNFVCGDENFGSGVLIRALEPWSSSIYSMKRLRSKYTSERRLRDPKNLCSGPNMLCQALGVTHDYDGKWLYDMETALKPLRLYRPVGNVRVSCGSRIGINVAVNWPRRYVLDDCRASQLLSEPLKNGGKYSPELMQEEKSSRALKNCKCAWAAH